MLVIFFILRFSMYQLFDRPQTLCAVRSSLRTLALSGNAFIADRVLAAVVRALTSTAYVADSDDATNAANKTEAVGGFPRLEVLRLSHMHAPPSVAACANGMSALRKLPNIYALYVLFSQFMFLDSYFVSVFLDVLT
jgi:hypothetical protein